MPRATHTIGFRHFAYGRWREPRTYVDASAWQNRHDLEKGGYLQPLPADVEIEIPEEAVPLAEPVPLPDLVPLPPEAPPAAVDTVPPPPHRPEPPARPVRPNRPRR